MTNYIYRCQNESRKKVEAKIVSRIFLRWHFAVLSACITIGHSVRVHTAHLHVFSIRHMHDNHNNTHLWRSLRATLKLLSCSSFTQFPVCEMWEFRSQKYNLSFLNLVDKMNNSIDCLCEFNFLRGDLMPKERGRVSF